MITFPTWYKGGYPIVERVVADLLTPYLAQLGPTPGTACTQLPGDYSTRTPIVQVYRLPGGVDSQTRMDHSIVYIGAIAAVPDDDWALYEYCRQILLAYQYGGTVTMSDGTKVFIDTITEMQGPEQVAEMNPQFRLTPGTFHVVVRKPRGLPNYTQVLAIN